ncbi:MAG: UDP-N-acetylmuramoyl-L-alanine--D-glutamate ligase [Actinomycetaceae bacterium]|nr:UDP-N-acetylmuramoyl-L-alanine--D-glutamate ligase [Arcanobacterium sp.]MDD7505421.1 UDP-N-acetylmuramoyl-L-alanine--D-glutamate ligase [Actinomycetaceae bacterium]MDY6142770.1 UDP-N-acetylmuramoyl-L-alanine--D-glutamate ligase [Arcanobacterium sp.]
MSDQIPGAAFFDGKTVAVLGLGISGQASVEALRAHTQASISVWDARDDAVKPYRGTDRITHAYADSQPERLITALLDTAPDIVVIAPAFRHTGVEWQALREAKATVWSEIELAWHLRAAHPDGTFAPWVCITGTNGKTTTTTMLAHILDAAGMGGVAVGNVGNPAVTAVSDLSSDAPRVFAFELSSFQLTATYSVEPLASVCLNVADDHLEWHGTREAYRDAKANIYNRVHKACVYPVGDSVVQEMVDDADVVEGARAIGFVIGTPSIGEVGIVSTADGDSPAMLEDQLVIDRAFGPRRATEPEVLFTLADIAHLAPIGMDLPLHIVKDAMAAATLARAAGAPASAIQSALRSFTPGKHRIENLGTLEGARWIDDSKATNAHAAAASLLAQNDASVVWIVGGLAKGAQFTELVERVESRIAAAVVIGVDQQPWKEAFASVDFPVTYIDPASATPMRDAVRCAAKVAHPGNTVLLAPASASQDQFRSYAERGDAFAEEFRSLAHDRSSEV